MHRKHECQTPFCLVGLGLHNRYASQKDRSVGTSEGQYSHFQRSRIPVEGAGCTHSLCGHRGAISQALRMDIPQDQIVCPFRQIPVISDVGRRIGSLRRISWSGFSDFLLVRVSEKDLALQRQQIDICGMLLHNFIVDEIPMQSFTLH